MAGWFKKEPRDMVGQNPTGRPTKSSSRKRRQAINKSNRDLEGTEWELENESEEDSESDS